MITLSVRDADGRGIPTPMLVEVWAAGQAYRVEQSRPAEEVGIETPETARLIRVRVGAAGYRRVGYVLRFGEHHASISLPIDASEASPIFHRAPHGLDRVFSTEVALEAEQRAGLWNIWAKVCTEKLGSGLALDELVLDQGVEKIQRDRLWARVAPAMRVRLQELAAKEEGWDTASSAEHDSVKGYHRRDSFKTDDHYGNLQVTFFKHKTERDHLLAEFDIDEAAGLKHVFQVLRNDTLETSTHPYDIREILVHHQGVKPGYSLEVAA